MKRSSVFVLFILNIIILSAQEFKPLADCKDTKDRILVIQKSFEKLSQYKDTEIKKEGMTTFYSSKFDLCGNKAMILESEYEISLKFEFESKNYKGDINDISISGNKVLTVVKDVFNKWNADESKKSDEESKSTIYYFIEDGTSTFETKNYVKLHSFVMDDYRSYSIEFVHKK